MLYFLKAFLFIGIVIISFIFGLIILGEYLASKYKGSKFAKWWNDNVITQMPDDYED
jgi:hypothetical protein